MDNKELLKKLWEFYAFVYKDHAEVDSSSERSNNCAVCWNLRQLWNHKPEKLMDGWRR